MDVSTARMFHSSSLVKLWPSRQCKWEMVPFLFGLNDKKNIFLLLFLILELELQQQYTLKVLILDRIQT